MMTYGEAWLKAKEQNQSLDTKFDDCISMQDFKHKKRMPRKEAGTYYKNKINQEFKRLGYKAKELTVKDFDNVDCYFGYFEALKIMNNLRMSA